MLRAGWNDLTIDYNQVFDDRRTLHIQLAGPDFPSSTEIPRDRLRPVESADDRLVFGATDEDIKIPAAGSGAAIALMPVVGLPGEKVAALDILYEVSSKQWEQIRVELEPPSAPGTRVPIRVDDNSLGENDQIAQLTIPADAPRQLAPLLGGPPDGTWKLYVSNDTANDTTGTLFTAKLTLHTTAGPERIARVASWTSQVLPFEAPVTEIDSVTWDEHVPEGTTLIVEVGSCQTADCSDVSWATASSHPTSISPASYLQLRVRMTSDGIAEPELRDLHLQAR
jgi:subtilisin-like proprotein convertase family protein